MADARGRLAYAEDVATSFEQNGVHSTIWIWRSYRKSKWGFELVHEDDDHRETEDVRRNCSPSPNREKLGELACELQRTLALTLSLTLAPALALALALAPTLRRTARS